MEILQSLQDFFVSWDILGFIRDFLDFLIITLAIY